MVNKKLRGMRTYNSAFVVSSKKVRASSYKDHAATDKQCFLEASLSDITEYVPCKALHNLDVERRFDIAYLIAKHKHSHANNSCQDKTGTCQVKSNDVLTLCQSNFKTLSGALLCIVIAMQKGLRCMVSEHQLT